MAAIAKQSRAPDQLIIVDQDPLPETREVVTQSGLPVTYVEQERRGLSASRKSGAFGRGRGRPCRDG